MTEHKIGTREQWAAAREELLAREKEHTRLGDELVLMGYYGILDRVPKGRDEGDGFQLWIRPHDEY
jgi:predicted dithiol-disulfide oxidoreductase (DUF899 family)